MNSPKHKPAFVCSHIFENERDELLVSHADGDWQFLCGYEHNKNEIPKVVGINHLLASDESLLDIIDLPVNWEAERKSISQEWVKTQIK